LFTGCPDSRRFGIRNPRIKSLLCNGSKRTWFY
jgi:hypothetical protein